MKSSRARASLRVAIVAIAIGGAVSFVLLRDVNLQAAKLGAPAHQTISKTSPEPLQPAMSLPASRSPDAEHPSDRDAPSTRDEDTAIRSPFGPPNVRFQVFDPDGAPARHGMIRAVRGAFPREEPLRGDPKDFEWDVTCREAVLPFNRWTFQAVAASDAIRQDDPIASAVHDRLSEKVTIDVRLGDEPCDVVLHFEQRPAIYGVVKGGPSKFYVSVFCWRIDSGAGIDQAWLWSRESRRTMRQTSFDPYRSNLYAFENLRPGLYAVGAGAIGRSSPPTIVQLGELSQRIDVAAPTGAQPGDVFVRLHGPVGTEPDSITFALRSPGDDSQSRSSGAVKRGEDGRFLLKLGRCWMDDVASPSHQGKQPRLYIWTSPWGIRSVELHAEERDVDIWFDPPASLLLDLTRFDATAVAAKVQVSHTFDAESVQIGTEWRRDEQPAANGRCTLSGFQPGRGAIELSWAPRIDKPDRSSLMKREIDLQAGSNHEEIELPSFHDLTVRWNDVRFGTPVNVNARSIEQSELRVGVRENESTEVRFDFLPAGTYDVTVKGPLRESTRRVTLDRSTTIDVSD